MSMSMSCRVSVRPNHDRERVKDKAVLDDGMDKSGPGKLQDRRW